MPHDRFDWLRRIRAVEREHSATRLAVERFLTASKDDPSILRGDLKVRDIRHALDRLDGTYLIRLFAEFEAGLRLYWETLKNTVPPAEHLLDGITARRYIPNDLAANAHSVREYRNTLLHERETAIAPIPIAIARSHLCRFFDRLPESW